MVMLLPARKVKSHFRNQHGAAHGRASGIARSLSRVDAKRGDHLLQAGRAENPLSGLRLIGSNQNSPHP
jgi:hypothetical protein